MKKWIVLSLSLLILTLVIIVSAETPATDIKSVLTRNVKIFGRNADGSLPNNPVITGESPTTGLPTSNISYVPILVQIDNNVGPVPQWGISSADIIYELPIQGQGWTRLTALFSDEYPQEAGPVRSGRVMHADLREEWDALLVHYGKQEVSGSDMREALRKYGVTAKGLDIDGIGNKYKDYFSRVKYHVAPHNVTAYVYKLYELILQQGYQFPVRPFKFTDNMNYGGIIAGKVNVIHKGNQDTSSTFVYNTENNVYYRYVARGAYYDLFKPAEQLSYSNVIIQRTKLSFNGNSSSPVLSEIVGTGACDIFIAGQYIAGVWTRHRANERTVFFDQNGNEISLQRGKTWVIICDDSTLITIGDMDKSQTSRYFTYSSSETEPTVLNSAKVASNQTAIPSVKFPDQTVNPAIVSPEQTVSPVAVSPDQILTTESISGIQPTQQPSSTNGIASDNMAYATVKVANNGLLNMRKKASKTSDIISRIKSGSTVQVISTDEKWTSISFEGKKGYVVTEYLVFSQPTVDSDITIQAEYSTEYSPLKSGDRGSEVMNLKMRLYELGYFRTSNLNDQYIDSTVEAVKKFEKRNELPVDGIADVEMLNLLYSDIAKKH